MLEFEWDPAKARTNEQKHGVSFFEACEVFDDDYSSTVRDPDHSEGEERHLIFGLSKAPRYLVISYTDAWRTNSNHLGTRDDATRAKGL